MLIDPKLTSIRLVLNSEKMVINEAQRTSTYFHLFGYPMDLVVANRILPRALIGMQATRARLDEPSASLAITFSPSVA